MKNTPWFLSLALAVSACPASYTDDDDILGAWGDDDDMAPPVAPEEVFDDPGDVADDICEDALPDPLTLSMSADDSNSQAQPALARGWIRDGLGLGGALRPYEFLNYYDFDYAPADPGTVDVVPQLRDDGEGGYTMLVAVVAPHVDPQERRPVNLTFSIDTSCSMGGAGLARVEETLRAVAGELREGDLVSVSTWSTASRVLVDSHAITGANDPVLLSVANNLGSAGSTDLEGGLATAYNLASNNYAPGRLNRVVFLSDGGANTGVTSEDLIAQHAEDGNGEGIYLVAVGASAPGGYSDSLMNHVSDLGKGSYVFLDGPAEAERMFTGERLLSTLEVAARDVRLDVTLPPGFVLDVFHGEEVSTNPAEVEPQHLAPNDQMLYHFTLADCAGPDDGRTFGFDVTFLDPETRQERTVSVSRTVAELLAAPRRQLEKADVLIS
jgi:Ca-activated chloride channel family protein